MINLMTLSKISLLKLLRLNGTEGHTAISVYQKHYPCKNKDCLIFLLIKENHHGLQQSIGNMY